MGAPGRAGGGWVDRLDTLGESSLRELLARDARDDDALHCDGARREAAHRRWLEREQEGAPWNGWRS